MKSVVLALIRRVERWLEPDGVRALTPSIKEMSGSIPGDADIFDPAMAGYANKSLAEQRAIVFRNQQGMPLPLRAAWGGLPYEELAPMFLDQFLLRYFAGLLRWTEKPLSASLPPWEAFVAASPFGWPKEMPLLFEQLTGYKLNDRQLNEAIGEYVNRLEKSQGAETASTVSASRSALESRNVGESER